MLHSYATAYRVFALEPARLFDQIKHDIEFRFVQNILESSLDESIR